MESQFENWKISNVKYEADASKLLNKKRKIITMKWYQRGLASKA